MALTVVPLDGLIRAGTVAAGRRSLLTREIDIADGGEGRSGGRLAPFRVLRSHFVITNGHALMVSVTASGQPRYPAQTPPSAMPLEGLSTQRCRGCWPPVPL